MILPRDNSDNQYTDTYLFRVVNLTDMRTIAQISHKCRPTTSTSPEEMQMLIRMATRVQKRWRYRLEYTAYRRVIKPSPTTAAAPPTEPTESTVPTTAASPLPPVGIPFDDPVLGKMFQGTTALVLAAAAKEDEVKGEEKTDCKGEGSNEENEENEENDSSTSLEEDGDTTLVDESDESHVEDSMSEGEPVVAE